MKLKKKLLTKFLQRVRIPERVSLSEHATFYSKLLKKYGNSANLRLIYRNGYYDAGGYWLAERRMETTAELKVRQTKLDVKRARQQALKERYRAAMRRHALESRAKDRAAKALAKKVAMEKKVEEVKTMVSVLKAAGYAVSAKTVAKVR